MLRIVAIATMRANSIADLSCFRAPSAEPAPDRSGRFLGSIVWAATAARTTLPIESLVRCRRRPGGRACPGQIGLRMTERPAEIRWCCSACGDHGVIRNWQGSRWDAVRRR